MLVRPFFFPADSGVAVVGAGSVPVSAPPAGTDGAAMVVVAPDEGDERRLRGLEGDTWVACAGSIGTPSKGADPGKEDACCWFKEREGELVVVDVLIRLEVGEDLGHERNGQQTDESATAHGAGTWKRPRLSSLAWMTAQPESKGVEWAIQNN